MKIRFIAFLAIIALLVAACSSDDDSASEDAAENATVTTLSQERTEGMTRTTVVDVAIGNNFETLVAAVQAAGLVETLQGEGPFTVFAPTDEAFAALPEGTLDSLLADPEALADILTYHVVAGKVLAEDVVGLSSATSVQGSDIAIEVVDGGVVLNGSANVIATDVEADNGVVHVIDAVILPPAA